MRLPARLNVAVSLLAISVVAACSDNTGPSAATAAQVAAHFDSIAIQTQAQDDNSVRGSVASFIELAAASGVAPTTVSVTTAGGNEHWNAYELLDRSGPGAIVNDSSYILILYRDSDAHTAVIAEISSAGDVPLIGAFTLDTLLVLPTSASGSSTLTSVGATCTVPSSSLLNPQLDQIAFSVCNVARFQTSFSMTLPETPGLDASLASVAFSTTALNGVRVVDIAQGAGRRLHDMLRTPAARRHK